jgi:hypothetical protein
MKFHEYCATSAKTIISQTIAFYTPIDADFQCEPNASIFIENEGKLMEILYKYFRWLKNHQICRIWKENVIGFY